MVGRPEIVHTSGFKIVTGIVVKMCLVTHTQTDFQLNCLVKKKKLFTQLEFRSSSPETTAIGSHSIPRATEGRREVNASGDWEQGPLQNYL